MALIPAKYEETIKTKDVNITTTASGSAVFSFADYPTLKNVSVRISVGGVNRSYFVFLKVNDSTGYSTNNYYDGNNIVAFSGNTQYSFRIAYTE